MVFKKPYAFFIKYFRVINFLLTLLLCAILYKLNELRIVINSIYLGKTINYSNLSYDYLGFKMYFFVFLALLFLSIIVILLRRKNKPLADYGFAILYFVALIIFFIVASDLFYTLENITVEPATLKIYSDVSLLIAIPMIYFIFKFFLISIGFNLKKFDFTKDLIELKSEADDNEEVELVLSKDSYKYKRKFRRSIREFKYYILENKVVLSIIFFVIFIVLGCAIGVGNYDSNEFKLNESFVAGYFTYNVKSIYETSYDLNHNTIKQNNKFVVAKVSVRNNSNNNSNIDFKRIRLMYDDEFIYPNSYFNDNFIDMGTPYNGQLLLAGESKEYIFIFKVPSSYKSNKYELKFYDKNVSTDEEFNASYKVVKVTAMNLDKNFNSIDIHLSEKILLNKEEYGESYITIKAFDKLYKYQSDNDLILPDSVNHVLVMIDYNLDLDKNNKIASSINNKTFFSNYVFIKYKVGGKYKTLKNIDILKSLDGKIFMSVPYNIMDSDDIQLILSFRTYKYVLSL